MGTGPHIWDDLGNAGGSYRMRYLTVAVGHVRCLSKRVESIG